MDFSFAPSNSFRDLYRSKHAHTELLDDVAVREVQLDVEPHKGNSSFTSCGSAWNAFLSHAQEHVVRTDDHAFVCTAEEVGWKIGYRRFFSLTTTIGSNDLAPTSTHSPTKLYIWAPYLQAAIGTCDILLQLLPTCSDEIHSVQWKSMAGKVEFPVSARVLAAYLEHQKHSSLVFTMDSFTLSTELCHVLGTVETSSDIVIEISKCRFRTDTGARYLAESLRNLDVGPKFQWKQCDVDFRHLSTALVGTSRLTSLELSRGSCARFGPGPPTCLSDAELAALFKALGKNQGLMELDLSSQPVSDDNWLTLSQSLTNHATLQVLNLTATQHWKASSRYHFESTESKDRRPAGLQAVNTILKSNTELHTVHLSSLSVTDQDYDRCDIRPLLRFNKCRRRVHQVQQTQTSVRQQVLGRALGTIADDPNLIWVFVSKNADALVSSSRRAAQIRA